MRFLHKIPRHQGFIKELRQALIDIAIIVRRKLALLTSGRKNTLTGNYRIMYGGRRKQDGTFSILKQVVLTPEGIIL
jgi:hypothetical protein